MKPIPHFPDRKKLSLNDKGEIENFCRKFQPYSDFNFTSLYCYNVNDKVEVSWLNGNLVVLFQDYMTDEVFYSFLGDNRATETALTILNHADKSQIKSGLRLIPEHTIKLFNGDNTLLITEDKNNFDYILFIPALSEYKGKEFSNKRGHVNQFKRKYPTHDIRILDLNNADTKMQLLDLCRVLIEKKIMNISNTHELPALERLLKNTNYFNVFCLGIFVHDNLRSFIICEQLDSKYVIIHFEKSDIYFVGISPLLLQELSKVFKAKGCSYLNYEQDLGIEGLRTMKQRYRPDHYLKKYIISRNNHLSAA